MLPDVPHHLSAATAREWQEFHDGDDYRAAVNSVISRQRQKSNLFRGYKQWPIIPITRQQVDAALAVENSLAVKAPAGVLDVF